MSVPRNNKILATAWDVIYEADEGEESPHEIDYKMNKNSKTRLKRRKQTQIYTTENDIEKSGRRLLEDRRTLKSRFTRFSATRVSVDWESRTPFMFTKSEPVAKISTEECRHDVWCTGKNTVKSKIKSPGK